MVCVRNVDQENIPRSAIELIAMAVVITNSMKSGILMIEKAKFPQCCGHDMRIKTDLGKFLEVCCDVCSDVIYVRKQDASKPQMLDD